MDWIGIFIIPGVLAVWVYVLSKLLRMREARATRPPLDKRKLLLTWTALLALIPIGVLLLYLLSHMSLRHPNEPDVYNAWKTLLQLSLNIGIMLPFLLVKWRGRESWASTGVSGEGAGKALLIGLLAAMTYIVSDLWRCGVGFGEALGMLNMNFVWALPTYAIVGFSEEWIFRGYVQPRFEVWLGRVPGWLLASLIMAMIHVPQRMIVMGMPASSALLDSLGLLPLSLLFGYMRMRTGTIWASAVLHTGVNWENVFFGG